MVDGRNHDANTYPLLPWINIFSFVAAGTNGDTIFHTTGNNIGAFSVAIS
jgi:hypothetical protein